MKIFALKYFVILNFIVKTIPALTDEEYCDINACDALDKFRRDLDEHLESYNETFKNDRYELVRIERRVRSLEEPCWQVSSGENRWSDCVKSTHCNCKPETNSLSCWNEGLLVLPEDQIVPDDVLGIDIGINFFTTLNKKVFRGLRKIIEIDMFNNRIDHLPDSIFENLLELKYLRLHKNLLEEISENLLSSQKSLITLDLSDNKLWNLPSRLFQRCTKLTMLHLSLNKLQTLHKNLFDNLVILEDLDLSRNKINVLEKSIFKNLINLKRLNLAENKLVNLEAGSLNSLTSLDYLNLRRNEILVIRKNIFSSLSNLTILNLSSNKIVKIDLYSFSHLRKLQELHLEQNVIYELDEGLFQHLESLEKLFLFSNNLEELNKHTFYGLGNLTTLFLNNNLLSVIRPGVFSFVPKLRKLHLDSNNFEYLPPKSLDVLKNLSAIKLTKNPWHCDCNMLYLSAWIFKNSNKLWDSQPTCRGPGELGGAPLKDMNFDKLCHGQWASMVHLSPRIPIRPHVFKPRQSLPSAQIQNFRENK